MNQQEELSQYYEHLLNSALEKGINFFGTEDSQEKRLMIIDHFRRFLNSKVPEVSETFRTFLEMLSQDKLFVIVYPEDRVKVAGILTEDCDKTGFKELNDVLFALYEKRYELFLSISDSKIGSHDDFAITILHEIGGHFARWKRGEFLGRNFLDEEVGAVIETAILYSELKLSGELLDSPLYDEIIKEANSESATAESFRDKITFMLAGLGYRNAERAGFEPA